MGTSMKEIVKRYKQILKQEVSAAYPGVIIKIKPMPGEETHDIHLLWMLSEIKENRHQTLTKKHRWLGYIQGVMTSKGYITVTEERELTRDILNGR